jgi:hypothetical protein
MKVTLGRLEQAILLACLAHQNPERQENKPDLYRDELPALLWGWNGQRLYRGWSWARDANRQPQTYPEIPAGEYRAKQAALTRALQSLYQKDLIDAGNSYEATGLTIYSPRRAAAMGIEPAQPLSEAEMCKRYYPKIAELASHSWSYKSTGRKPRMNRNIKAIRLTEVGELVARQLQVKSQKHSCDLTRIAIEVDQPPPPLPPTEVELEAQRQELAAAEVVIRGASGGADRS